MIEVAPISYQKRMSWYDAVMYCNFLDIDGKCDWRLPDITEAGNIEHILIDNSYALGAYIWSSTPPEDDWDDSYIQTYNPFLFQQFNQDGCGVLAKSNTNTNLVVPVRDIK